MLNIARTSVGRKRKMNQDNFYVSKDGSLNVLADGMGGYAGGEVASRLATVATVRYLKDNFDKDKEYQKEDILKVLSDAIQYANEEVYHKSKEVEELEQMGTTLEICLVYKDRVYIAHIGDSRIYRIRKGIMRRITKDHSYVQTLVEDGTITKEEAEHHPKKNMLIKALGCEEKIEPDVMVKGFQEGDVILICSDGLTNMVSEQQIFNIIENNIESAADELIRAANNNGGADNITVIIIKK